MQDIIFQFTPLREGRRWLVQVAARRGYFNSRPSARGDAAMQLAQAGGIISIHAPPRGATMLPAEICPAASYFNSRPSARGDDGWGAVLADWRHFNSRPSARGDMKRLTQLWKPTVFQFTPLREGRLDVGFNVSRPNISIHAPPRGATCREATRRDDHFYFNSRPSARGDEGTAIYCDDGFIFQFTPLREGRRMSYTTATPTKYFNSRPSARGDMRTM